MTPRPEEERTDAAGTAAAPAKRPRHMLSGVASQPAPPPQVVVRPVSMAKRSTIPAPMDVPSQPPPPQAPAASAGPRLRAPATDRGGGGHQQKYSVLDSIREGKPHTPAVHANVGAADAVIDVKQFNLFYGKHHALHNITMSVPRGQVTALIGPSGCGKSTLLRSCNRLNDLIEGVSITGDILLRARPVYAPDVDVIDLRKRMGMVFQKPNPFPMSIYDNIAYPLRIHGERRRATIEQAVERALRGAALWAEVKDRLKQSALGLSGGQQQRLCIARAIVAEPEVLLLDEPTSALDPIAAMRIEELIHEISTRYTVLIVTHNMQQAARVSDYTAFMYLGRLVEYGRTEEVFQRPHLPETEQYVTGRFG